MEKHEKDRYVNNEWSEAEEEYKVTDTEIERRWRYTIDRRP